MNLERTISGLLGGIAAAALVIWLYGSYQQKPVPAPDSPTVEPPAIRPRSPGQYVKVLALDGGGLRMIPALHCLAYLEKRAGKPVSQLFDVIVGTSAGGFIAAALTAPAEGGRPKMTAQELLEKFPSFWTRMCSAPLIHPLLSLEGRTAPKFLTRERQRVLQEIFGKVQTGEALTTIILPAYALEHRTPFLFASDMGKSTTPSGTAGRAITEAGDYYLADALMAATGDPAVFAPSIIKNVTQDSKLTFVSGQGYAANPTLLAVSEALLRFPGRSCVVISLGAGNPPPEHVFPAAGWDGTAAPMDLLGAVEDASTVATHQITSTFHRFGSGPVAAYIRLDAGLDASALQPYDFSKGNIEALNRAGVKLTTEKMATLDRSADFLAAP